ncbi:MAG: electron transport complex subunit RsxE [Candidatus Thermoplasmatota archaeon]|nr:electron transport complex subunit RsxE [Candidatus Thermoplasmatota archaeon]
MSNESEKVNLWDEFFKGIGRMNPIYILLLGLCSALAITTRIENAIVMSIGVMFVLIFSTVIISIIRNVVPGDVRIPVFISIIAGFVTLFGFFTQAYLPTVYSALGVYLSLITTNCIIFGRAEAYAGKNPILPTLIDGLGMGAGYSLAIIGIAVVREILGFGEMVFQDLAQFEITVLPFQVGILQQPAGAYIVMAGYLGFFMYLSKRKERKRKGAISLERERMMEERTREVS